MRRHRKALAFGIAVLVALGVAGYAAAGLVVVQTGFAEKGGCHAEHAGFTPASFSTAVWVSDDFDASTLDVTPYLMPAFSEVSFPARGEPAVTIRAWWVPGAEPDSPALVVVHGGGSCRRDPAILVPAGMLHREGFGVLLMDMRNNGDSTLVDGRFGAGSVEYRDVLGAWDWLVGRGIPTARIGLFGQSGGAMAVMVAMGEEPQIAAGWEESGAADVAVGSVEELRRDHYPEFLAPAAIFWLWLLGDDVVNRNPLSEAHRYGMRPFQVVHGTADKRVAVHHAMDLEAVLRAANPASHAWILDGGQHVQGPFLAPAEYQRRLGAFFRAALGS
jgi:dipeptidyl aminopeptidase/acylaminoacyl peptidase